METKSNEVVEIDLKEIFYVLLHKLWIIIIAGCLVAGIAYANSKYLTTPIYTSTSKIYVINRQYEDMTTWSDLQSGSYLAKDFMILIKSRPVTEEVIQELDLNMSHQQLSGMITVNAPLDTRILEINVLNQDPIMAKLISDTIAKVASERLVSVMEMDKVNIVEEGAIPDYPTSPNIFRNTIIGGLIGAILVSSVIIMIYILNDRIRTAEDVEKYLGLTTLGLIPNDNKISKNINKKKKIKNSKTALAG